MEIGKFICAGLYKDTQCKVIINCKKNGRFSNAHFEFYKMGSLGDEVRAQVSLRLTCTLPPTFLQHLQVLPQDVSHVRRRTCYERLLAHGTDVLPFHVELMHCSALKRELPDCPAQPMGHVRLIPLPRICKHDDTSSGFRRYSLQCFGHSEVKHIPRQILNPTSNIQFLFALKSNSTTYINIMSH